MDGEERTSEGQNELIRRRAVAGVCGVVVLVGGWVGGCGCGCGCGFWCIIYIYNMNIYIYITYI